MKSCSICHHEEHDPGKCPQDNCGQSEISHGDAISTDHTQIVTWQSFRRGEVSTTDVAHIKPRRTRN
jgi:hypothetical protein